MLGQKGMEHELDRLVATLIVLAVATFTDLRSRRVRTGWCSLPAGWNRSLRLASWLAWDRPKFLPVWGVGVLITGSVLGWAAWEQGTLSYALQLAPGLARTNCSSHWSSTAIAGDHGSVLGRLWWIPWRPVHGNGRADLRLEEARE